MVDVEVAPLGPFEKDPLSLVDLPLQDQGAIGDIRPEPFGIGPVLLERSPPRPPVPRRRAS